MASNDMKYGKLAEEVSRERHMKNISLCGFWIFLECSLSFIFDRNINIILIIYEVLKE